MVKTIKKRRNIIFIIIAVLAVVLLFNDSFLALVHNSLKIRELNKKITALDKEYKELETEYNKILSGDRSYLEKEARVNYNMAMEGEIEFRIKK
ncbi:MAG: septum formation initiator family protein [Elusimicrobiaceae bacterium]|nr:septum formation initiator family protein [Elusimicrobiaceae bacterium]